MPGYKSGSHSNSGTGEQDLFLANVVNGVSTDNNPAFSEISISSTFVGVVENGDTITVINDGFKDFYFRDISDASRTNANIRTPGHVDRMLQKGGRTNLTYWLGNWYLNQDRT
jgi:3,4-dihydroxy-2-butanone 4-phosphate synthase